MRLSHSRLATTMIAGLFIAAACTPAASPAPPVSTTVTPIPPPTPVVTPATTPGSLVPVATDHADPALEARLPDNVDGIALTKKSYTADQISERPDPRLVSLGKDPAELTIATASHLGPPMVIVIWLERLRGVSGDQLLAATLESMPGAPASQASLGGHEVTVVDGGTLRSTWHWATGDLLYRITTFSEETAAPSEETVARILTGLR